MIQGAFLCIKKNSLYIPLKIYVPKEEKENL